MYARLLLFTIDPNKSWSMQDVVTKLDGLLKKRRGFKGATYLCDDELGEYGALVLWESPEDAVAARNPFLLRFKQVVDGLLKEPIWYPLFEVVEPRLQ